MLPSPPAILLLRASRTTRPAALACTHVLIARTLGAARAQAGAEPQRGAGAAGGAAVQGVRARVRAHVCGGGGRAWPRLCARPCKRARVCRHVGSSAYSHLCMGEGGWGTSCASAAGRYTRGVGLRRPACAGLGPQPAATRGGLRCGTGMRGRGRSGLGPQGGVHPIVPGVQGAFRRVACRSALGVWARTAPRCPGPTAPGVHRERASYQLVPWVGGARGVCGTCQRCGRGGGGGWVIAAAPAAALHYAAHPSHAGGRSWTALPITTDTTGFLRMAPLQGASCAARGGRCPLHHAAMRFSRCGALLPTCRLYSG